MNKWPEISRNPLPPELASLPSVVAEPWIQLHPGADRGLLEGSIFDRNGNLFICLTTRPQAKILRITPDKEVSEFFIPPEGEMPVGLAVHRDGRIFAATLCGKFGKILIIRPDGTFEREIIPEWEGKPLRSDDLVFDNKGNLFFTDFSGSISNPAGGVYRLDAADDYKTMHKLLGNIAGGNGISFSPDFGVLWVAETVGNSVLRLIMTPDGFVRPSDLSVIRVYRGTGRAVCDSNKVDSAGNLYQAMMWSARALVLNKDGFPIGNVLIPGREEGKYPDSPNLAIRPNSSEGYLIGTGVDGAWLFRFPTLAPAQTLFADM